MVKKLKVGVVGAGHAGKLHLRALKHLNNVEIKTICDMNQDVVSKVAQEFGIPKYHIDFNTMLSETKLDFITICTPPNSHASLCIKAIESGVHVLVEKPFTQTTQEALSILNALENNNNNVKVGVIHNSLFSRVTQKAIELVKNGEIGNILNVNIIETAPFNADPFITNMDHWHHKIPGGRICESLPHQVYLAQEFIQTPKVSNILAKKLGNAHWVSFDEALITLESDSASGTIHWSRNAGIYEYAVYLIGSEGTIRINMVNGVIVIVRRSSNPILPIHILNRLDGIRQTLFSFIRHNVGKQLRKCGIRQAYYSPHEVCFNSFIDNIINNQEPYVNAQKGYENMLVVDEICTQLQNLLVNK